MLPLFSIITLAAIPRIINSYEDGKDVKPLISKLTEIYFVWFLPITLFLCTYPKEIVLLFSNSNFSNAYILIPFLSLSAFCLGLTELTTLQYYLVKKTKIDMALRLVSGFLGIILNILILPKFGLWAVGLSALVSQLLYLLLSCIIKIKGINWHFPIKPVLKAFIALIFCSIFSFILRNIISTQSIFGFISQTVIFFGVYTVIIKFLTFKNILPVD
jgi:O-antigen/teichoic acid export membrane protein